MKSFSFEFLDTTGMESLEVHAVCPSARRECPRFALSGRLEEPQAPEPEGHASQTLRDS